MWLEDPSTHAAQYVITPPRGSALQDWTGTVQDILISLAQSLQQQGCRLIGHIKVLAQGEPEGHLYASLISLEQGVSTRGEIPPDVREVRLTLNVIVYGIEKERLPEIADSCVRGRLPGACRVRNA